MSRDQNDEKARIRNDIKRLLYDAHLLRLDASQTEVEALALEEQAKRMAYELEAMETLPTDTESTATPR